MRSASSATLPLARNTTAWATVVAPSTASAIATARTPSRERLMLGSTRPWECPFAWSCSCPIDDMWGAVVPEAGARGTPTWVTMDETGHTRAALAGFLLGAAGMFAVMYSTQAILPELSREFDVSAAAAGLTVSIVILVLAAGAWVWGPLSDRWGRKKTLVLASALVAVPTLASALAPTFGVLLACRAVQGLCMPGLLTVGAPYASRSSGRGSAAARWASTSPLS